MLFEIFDDGKFLGFEDAPHEEAAIVVFANKRHPRADPFTTLAEVRQDQGFPHREVTAVAAYATMPPAAPASADDQASFASAFELFCRLDEAKATAARLRAAAGRTTGSEWRENIEGVGVAEAEATRIEAELRGEGHQSEAAAPERAPAKEQRTVAARVQEADGALCDAPEDWKVQARTIADELHAIDHKGGAHDSLTNIADRVAKCMRERGINGPRGPLAAGTILREALQGGRWKRKERIC